MESFHENNINKINLKTNFLSEIKKHKTFNHNYQKRLLLKKRANSLSSFNKNKKNKFSIQIDINDKEIKSIFLKSNTMQKISLENKNNSNSDALINSLRKSFQDFSAKKKLKFSEPKEEKEEEYANLKGNNIINNGNDNKLKKITKKYNSFDAGYLLFPFLSKEEYKKEDFEVLALSGKGAYGTVLQVKLKSENEKINSNERKNSYNNIKNKTKEQYYAIKVMDIDSMKAVNKFYQIFLESQILSELNSPFIVKIHGSFLSKGKIYLILDYLSKGNFATFLRMNFPLKEDTIRFYSAEIVLFLEYLQSQKIVHRDLKPENIMLNDNFHLKMIDFATARKIGYYYDKKEMKFKEDNYDLENNDDDIKGRKIIVNPDDDDDDDDEDEEEDDEEENGNNIKYRRKFKKMPQRNKTFVGTAEYVSPEVIEDQPAGFGADLWAFGVMLYQMFCGKTPFKGGNNYATFKNIEKLQISFPQNVAISENAKDLIKKILIKDPSKRLGAGEPNTDLDLEHLKKHPFFKGIKWKNIINQHVPNSKILKCKSNKKIIKRNKNEKTKNEMIENENKNLIILKQGILLKKSFWFHYNERYVILDNTPKITYKDPEKDIVKGVIYLNNKCRVYATRHDIFNLDTTHRVFKFKCKQNDMISWIDAIKDCIKNYAKE